MFSYLLLSISGKTLLISFLSFILQYKVPMCLWSFSWHPCGMRCPLSGLPWHSVHVIYNVGCYGVLWMWPSWPLDFEFLKDSSTVLLFFQNCPHHSLLLTWPSTQCLLKSWIPIIIWGSKLLCLLLFGVIWINISKEVGPWARFAPPPPRPLI